MLSWRLVVVFLQPQDFTGVIDILKSPGLIEVVWPEGGALQDGSS